MRRAGVWSGAGVSSPDLGRVHIGSGLSVPVELGGGRSGPWTCGRPAGWDQSEVSALQTYAGVVASVLGAGTLMSRRRSPPASGGQVLGPKLSDVAGEVAAGQPCHTGRPSPLRPRPSRPTENLAPQRRRLRRSRRSTAGSCLSWHPSFCRMALDHPDDRSGIRLEPSRSTEHPPPNRKVIGSNPTSGSKAAGQRLYAWFC
jgi:hypothetical protein